MKTSLSPSINKVYAGFPGVGKSKLSSNYPDTYMDSDSSKFDKSDFPRNYIEHIREAIKTHTILCSTHDTVRTALIEAGIPFTLVYPSLECRDEYLNRYRARGSSEFLIDMMEKNFHKFVQQCIDETSPFVTHMMLGKGEYLTDRMEP